MNKVLKFGIAPVPVQRARTLAIAAGTRQRGEDEPNVSRSLHTMAQYGLVKLTKHGRTVIPQATSEGVTVDFSWGG
jgi:predicted transcriptional regulator